MTAWQMSRAHVREAKHVDVTAHLPVIAPPSVHGYEGHHACVKVKVKVKVDEMTRDWDEMTR